MQNNGDNCVHLVWSEKLALPGSGDTKNVTYWGKKKGPIAWGKAERRQVTPVMGFIKMLRKGIMQAIVFDILYNMG